MTFPPTESSKDEQPVAAKDVAHEPKHQSPILPAESPTAGPDEAWSVPLAPYAFPYSMYHPPALLPMHLSVPPSSTLGSTYPDLSGVPDPQSLNDWRHRQNHGGVAAAFPEKLHKMLAYCAREKLQDVASFYPHGRAFAIHQPHRFVTEVMPQFFRQSKLTSFQRQLNLYGFQRIPHGPDHGGYYHEHFLRGRPGLAAALKRVTVKGKAKAALQLERCPEYVYRTQLP